MSKRNNGSEFDRYIATTFPHAQLWTDPIDFGDIHLRFELGGDHSNGTDERITQATDRAAELFLACNSADDDLVLIITDWDSPGDQMLSTESQKYLYSLLSGFHNSHRVAKMVATPTGSYPQVLFPTSLGKIDYRNILRGIAHLEQGRVPRIHASIYFLNQTRNLVFWMYDDRGCVIYADSRATIQSLYERRNDWLVDYHRNHFNAIFGATGS
jgi:hypothetical protein